MTVPLALPVALRLSALRLPVTVGPPWPIPMFYFYTLHQTLRKKEWSYDTEYYELVVSTVWYRTMVGTYCTVPYW